MTLKSALTEVHYEDQVVQVPVAKHVHVPMVQTVQKSIEVPQIQCPGELRLRRKVNGGRVALLSSAQENTTTKTTFQPLQLYWVPMTLKTL